MTPRESLLPVAEAIWDKAWPIRHGGHVYIFGKYMAVRFPDDGGPAVDPDAWRVAIGISPPFGIFDISWPDWSAKCIPPTIVEGRTRNCSDCDSRGHELGADCDLCGGTGEAECDMGHFHDCPRCKSVGRVRTGRVCSACDGSGKKRSKIVECHDSPRFQIDASVLLPVLALPGVKLATDCIRNPDETGMFAFVADGIEGIVMGSLR